MNGPKLARIIVFVGALLGFANATDLKPTFISAQPVWPEGREKE